MALTSYALTTVARVKTRAGISVSTFDTLLETLICAVTDWVESYCDRRFVLTQYTNEVYSGDGQRFVVLKQAPITELTSAQYRVGTPDNPTWTDFLASEYEIVGDGSSGMIRIYNSAPHGTNNLRFTYKAGYTLNLTTITSNNMPLDLVDLVEKIVVKSFKKRQSEGKSSETAGEAQVTWDKEMNKEDYLTLNRHKRVFLG